MNPASSRRVATALLLSLAGIWLPASAQYAWTDANGVRQYSDRPPPPSVPAARILKQPGHPQSAESAPEPVSSQAAASAVEPPSLAERNADFRKRRIEQTEKQKKSAEEARIAKENARNCERTRDYRKVLESGERIGRIGKDGERSFLSDEERAAELREAEQALKNCK
jgi:hypothetical protein